MRLWTIVTVLVLLCGVAGIAAAVWSSRMPVEAAPAAVEQISQYVDERGKTRLPKTYLITMPYDARIEEIALREGDPVKANEVVAQVVPSDLQNEYDEAKAVVERLQESIAENRDESVERTTEQQAIDFVTSMKLAVQSAENRVSAGDAKVAYWKGHLARTEDLYRGGTTTQEEYDRAKLDKATADVDQKENILVWQSMAAIESATKLLPKMITQYIDRKKLAGNVLQKQLDEAEARLRQMNTRADRGKMISPVDGVVLTRPVRNERLVAGGTMLMEIGRLEELEVEADILSQDVVDVKQGDEVEIYGPAIGARVGEGVRGTVHQVYPAGFTKISSLGVEQQRVKVIIRFAEGLAASLRERRGLGVDYRVRVRIFTDRKEEAITVPRAALFRGADGDWQVFAVRGGRARLAKISVGLINDRKAEVVEGLRENELVILSPEASLTDGTAVKPLVRE